MEDKAVPVSTVGGCLIGAECANQHVSFVVMGLNSVSTKFSNSIWHVNGLWSW